MVAAMAMAAAASWMAGVRDVRAPEPAILNGGLYGYGTSAPAVYVATGRTTTGTRLSPTMQILPICRALATDAPCTTTSATVGTKLSYAGI